MIIGRSVYLIFGQIFVALFAQQSAQAACTVSGRFSPYQNDTATIYAACDARGSGLVFTSGGETRFTSASIVAGARSGKLTQTGALSFRYQPNAGFRGVDAYTIKVCGESHRGAGCSTLHYRATVK